LDPEYFKSCFRVFAQCWENNDIKNDVDVFALSQGSQARKIKAGTKYYYLVKFTLTDLKSRLPKEQSKMNF
jgi:hypothetical protein